MIVVSQSEVEGTPQQCGGTPRAQTTLLSIKLPSVASTEGQSYSETL